MKTNQIFSACLTVIILCCSIGCGDKRKQQETEKLKQFTKQMDRVDNLIKPGMSYSNLIAAIGQPIWVDTNNDGSLKADYVFHPGVKISYGFITNGYVVYISNGVVSGKVPITGNQRAGE